MLLLDTCAFIWMCQGNKKKLTSTAAKILQQNCDDLFISAVSAFEIGQLTIKGQLEFPTNLLGWWNRQKLRYHVTEIPITCKIAIFATQLQNHHKDPGDRIIIATAMEHNLAILTPDKDIKQYSQVKTIW